MYYSQWGRTDKQISKLGFGAMGLDGLFGKHDDAYIIRSIHTALDAGVNFIDTARSYGRSEELVGRALKEWRGEQPFVATKALPVPFEGDNPGGKWHLPDSVHRAFPPGRIRESLEQSLQALKLDAVDLIQLHRYWPEYDEEAYWIEELNDLKKEGKVRYIGVSAIDHRHDLLLPLIRSGKVDAVQGLFNIFDSTALDAVIPECEKYGVSFIARIILDEGGLSGFLTETMEFPEGDFRKGYFDCLPRQIYINKVKQLERYIPDIADNLAELAIRFAIHHPGVTTALVSMQVQEYALQNIAAANKPLLSEDMFQTLRSRHRWVRNFYYERRFPN